MEFPLKSGHKIQIKQAEDSGPGLQVKCVRALLRFACLLMVAPLSVVQVGVVTCGGNTKLRAGIARGWLRMLGFHDRDVAVAFARPKGRKAVVVRFAADGGGRHDPPDV